MAGLPWRSDGGRRDSFGDGPAGRGPVLDPPDDDKSRDKHVAPKRGVLSDAGSIPAASTSLFRGRRGAAVVGSVVSCPAANPYIREKCCPSCPAAQAVAGTMLFGRQHLQRAARDAARRYAVVASFFRSTLSGRTCAQSFAQPNEVYSSITSEPGAPC